MTPWTACSALPSCGDSPGLYVRARPSGLSSAAPLRDDGAPRAEAAARVGLAEDSPQEHHPRVEGHSSVLYSQP